ncbi:hypothetical protein [Streptosporangium subroseum]|uniref:hypothetical protein n=1 Tax=Streptosporangium subroseum TaxID=106412 RepID=UPI00308F0E6C|nr:hypothetical protein OHB15_03315 [Streptosporangium subroseum]
MVWWQQLLLASVGIVLGGAISIATTLFATNRQWRNERSRRVEEQGRAAAFELIRLLTVIRDERAADDLYAPESSSEDFWERVERVRAWRDSVRMHASCLDSIELRVKVLEFSDNEYGLEWEHGTAVNYLRECCGAYLRYEPLPSEPKELREEYQSIPNISYALDAIESHEEWREEVKKDRKAECGRTLGESSEMES